MIENKADGRTQSFLAWLPIAIMTVVVVLTFMGCKPGIPGKYLQPDEMVEILYDYHIADGIVSTGRDNDTLALRTFRASILRKHEVSEADFDSSMVYYTRHTQLLKDVYTKLADRLNNEAVALGGASSGMSDGFSSSDTTDIWRLSQSFVLSPYAATNRLSFEVAADTAFHAGDRIILDFDAQFIYQDGMRDAQAVLAVTYDNDSTEVYSNGVMSTSHYQLQINNTGRLRVKSVRGFWILSDGSSTSAAASSTTLKLLIVNNVRLIRMHTVEPANFNNGMSESGDSLSGAKRDSLPPHPAKQPVRKSTPQSVPNQPQTVLRKMNSNTQMGKLKVER